MPPKYPAPFLSRRSDPRPVSQATEIFDTDFESDYEDDFDYSDESPRRSLANDSMTTISTYRDVRTPDSHMLGGYQASKDGITVRGPNGPHLFRSSMDSMDLKSTMEVDLVLAKTPTTATFSEALKLEAPVKKTYDLPTRGRTQHRQADSINKAVSNQDEEAVKRWTPQEVAFWMHTEGFDHGLVEKFLFNDISGSILLELRPEDLKELDIQSFGKRRRLMNSIQSLRDSARMSAAGYRTSDVSGEESWTSEDESRSSSTPPTYQTDEQRSYTGQEEIKPADSASIVAIEQVLPKEHKCSKGENCRKWQRQQQLLARLAEDLPKDSIHNGNVIVAGDPGNPRTAPNLLLNRPEQVPSVVASSDLLGPQQAPQFGLSREKLSEVQPRDPQESIRQYLNLQHLSTFQPVDDPVSPPQEISPDSFKASPHLTENLRTLPKLTIPNSHEPSSIFSAQRTITPSVLQNQPMFPQEQSHYGYDQMTSPGNYYRTSDDYRSDIYRQGTPASEMDVPVTAIPAGPIERDITQSVPPNMRFGHQRLVPLPDPILRPSSTRNDRPRRNHPFINTQGLQSLGRVEEGKVAVIERPEDLHGTGLFPRTANDFAHSGWMKKRKTTRLLRHEWEEHHFTLKGTQLAMFENERDSRRDSRALECIDVDDYAVACSSLASSSKLSAAFKKTLLKKTNTAADESAFAFSLVPSSKDKDKQSGVDRKALFLNGGKSHHFAVKTRDERIDWMRELMLAKALKRGKESGDSMEINGNMI
ncbi:hypothetical protein EIK77_010403 [Talaromyces pinophilus]|nr:hypothetical protein EIK77_010403 [Talaromyces pinophilus]PCH08123.1 Sterile alpha motif, type 2 [Penicillium occitanis (nom. inval.)]PCH10054.1 hypothetical protein PENOC_004570 [Penicillium occitanis (nom. inval.)]